MWAVAATVVLMEKLTLGGKITVYMPHDIKTILSQKASKWLTDSRLLKYELVLLDSGSVELAIAKSQNPAPFSYGEPTEDLEHECLELIEFQTRVREDLYEQPLLDGEVLFVDGSSRVAEGK